MTPKALIVPVIVAATALVSGQTPVAYASVPVILSFVALFRRFEGWPLNVSAALLGCIVGMQPHYGLPNAVLFVLLLFTEPRPFALVTGTLATAGPLLVVTAVLYQTGWHEESARVALLAGGLNLGFLVALWRPSARVSSTWAGCVGVAGVALIAVLPVGAGPVWPAYLAVSESDDHAAHLTQFLRRRAAGDARAGIAAAHLWIRHYQADLESLRFVCGGEGSSVTAADELASAAAACRAVNSPPGRDALPLRDFGLTALAAELDAERGVTPDDAPQWLLASLGRASLAPKDWREFNDRMDFQDPIPARVRGLRGHGVGTVRVMPTRDLGGFALNTITRMGGLRYALHVPVPEHRSLHTLTFTGVPRRGLRIELVATNGASISWGCNVGEGDDQVRMPESICLGNPGSALLDLSERLPGPLASMTLRGEFALRSLVAEGE